MSLLAVVAPDHWRAGRHRGHQLDTLAREVATCGRRLIQGVDRAADRSRLYRLTRVLRDLALVLPHTAFAISDLELWRWLDRLAGYRRAAAAAGDRHSLPCFVPCVFAPHAARLLVPPYGEQTVTAHLRELEALEAPPDVWVDAFRHAASTDAGVVIVAGDQRV